MKYLNKTRQIFFDDFSFESGRKYIAEIKSLKQTDYQPIKYGCCNLSDKFKNVANITVRILNESKTVLCEGKMKL